MAIILTERAFAFSVAEIYYEREKKNAELAAKKELVSLATKIDNAAGKGLTSIDFSLSANITKYRKQDAELWALVLGIIEDDIDNAGYTKAEKRDAKDQLTGYTIRWGTEEEEPVEPETPVDPSEGGNEGGSGEGGEGSSEGGEGSEEGGNEGGDNSGEGGEGGSEGGEGGDDAGQGGNEDIDDEPQPRVPQVVEDPTEDGLYTLRQLQSEDFVNGMDVLPDGVDSLDDLVYLEEPYDATIGPFYSMHDLPFRNELMYFVKELA